MNVSAFHHFKSWVRAKISRKVPRVGPQSTLRRSRTIGSAPVETDRVSLADGQVGGDVLRMTTSTDLNFGADQYGTSGFPLPPELTLIILRWAVSIPGALSPTFDSFFASAQYDFVSTSFRAEEAHATKLALVSVCREWYLLAKELLFEHLTIATGRGLEVMFGVLPQTPLNIRTRAKRLDVGSRGTDRLSTETTRSLMDLLPFLPNLEILCIEGQFNTPTERDLASCIASQLHHLKHLRCQHQLIPLGGQSIPTAHYYIALPGLQWFSGVWETRSEMVQLPFIQSDSLTTLSIEFEKNAALPTQGLKLPSLRSFAAIGIRRNNMSLLPFLDTHGPQITSLCLSFYFYDPGQLEGEILGRCPRLEELTRQDLWPMTKVAQTFPSITRFGLKTMSEIYPFADIALYSNISVIGGLRYYLPIYEARRKGESKRIDVLAKRRERRKGEGRLPESEKRRA